MLLNYTNNNQDFYDAKSCRKRGLRMILLPVKTTTPFEYSSEYKYSKILRSYPAMILRRIERKEKGDKRGEQEVYSLK